VADIYLDFNVIIIAVTLMIMVIGIFDFLPNKKEARPITDQEFESTFSS